MIQWNFRRVVRMTNMLFCAVLLLFIRTVCTDAEQDIPTEQRYQMTEDFVLSLQAGNQTAILSGTLKDGSTISGQEISLSAAPFIEDGVFFFPLQDVVTALGGTCNLEENDAHVQLFGRSIVYQVGSETLSIDRTSFHGGIESRVFSEGDVPNPDEPALPCLRDGVFFLPDSFCAEGGPSTGLEDADRYPGLALLILGDQLQSETAVQGISVGEQSRYQDLPHSIREEFQQTRRIPGGPSQGVWYDILVYEKPGMSVYVMEEWPGFENVLNGTICGLRVTEQGAQSPRGLQVGDAAQRARLLYGYVDSLNLTNRIVMEEENGTITAFGIFSRFYGPEQWPYE